MNDRPTPWPWSMVLVSAAVALLVVLAALEVFSMARSPLAEVLGDCVERNAGELVECDQ